MHRITFIIALAGLLITSDLTSQNVDLDPNTDVGSRFMLSAYMDIGTSTRQFRRNVNKDTGLGFGTDLLFQVQKNNPIWAGIGIQRLAFDRDRLAYSQEFDGEFYNYEDKTTSRLFMAHGILRFQPYVRFALRPYIQGSAGMHWFYTNTIITDTDLDERVERINENRDATLGFALHGGVQFVPNRYPDFRLDARVGYFRNASVEYLTYNPSLGGGPGFPIDFFEVRNSAVDIIGFHIGMTFVLREAAEYALEDFY